MVTLTDDPVWPAHPQTHVDMWTVDDLRAGDLVFSSKQKNADRYEILNQVAGQRWRHVGALIERGDELHVVEIDKNAFGVRPLSQFMTKFDRFGAARLGLAPACIAAATDRMEARIDDGHFYAFDDLFLAGMLSLTTRGIFVGQRARVRAALAAAIDAAKQGQVANALDSFTCSGFIQWAYESADGDCSIEHDRWRRAGSWPPRLGSIDELLADEGASLDAMFGDASLLDLLELTQAVDRSDDWKPIPDQYGEGLRVLWAAITGFHGGDAPERIVTDGRWVTPSDLWESRSVSARGELSKPTG